MNDMVEASYFQVRCYMPLEGLDKTFVTTYPPNDQLDGYEHSANLYPVLSEYIGL